MVRRRVTTSDPPAVLGPDRPPVVARSPISRLLAGRHLRLLALAALALLGGLAEAVVLVAIVQAAVALAGQASGSFTVGPAQLEDVGISLLLVMALVAALVRLATGLAVAWLGARLTADMQKQLRIEVFGAFVDADWPAQSREREGGLQHTVASEIDRASVAVLLLSTGLAAACQLSMLVGVALLVNLPGAIALIVVIGGLFVLLRPLTARARRQATARSREERSVAHAVDELVRTAEEIRVHGVGEQEKRRLAEESAAVAGWVARLNFASLSITHLYQAAALGFILAALFIANQVGAENAAGTGAMVLVLLRAFAYSQQLQHAHHQVGERMAAVDAIEQTLARFRASAARAGSASIDRIETLEFEHVTYGYRADHDALHDVSFTVTGGEVIGVVGPSGAGKSTLVQILLRLRLPQRGRYAVNGRDVSEYSVAAWTRAVSYLPQQPKVISGTVSDNIRFLRDVEQADIEEAARMAHLHEEILTWPQGYNTLIGQRAGALSGGQAQRLCLARALATKPSVLVLDEPTSALDAMSEYHIQVALEKLRGDATIFIVAHRLSTLSICDRVLVLRDGTIERLESRETLAAESGFYREALRISGLT